MLMTDSPQAATMPAYTNQPHLYMILGTLDVTHGGVEDACSLDVTEEQRNEHIQDVWHLVRMLESNHEGACAAVNDWMNDRQEKMIALARKLDMLTCQFLGLNAARGKYMQRRDEHYFDEQHKLFTEKQP